MIYTINNGQITINPTLYFNPEYVGKEIRVLKGTREAVATAYRNKVQMAVASKMSSIINLSLNDVVPQRADDILNTLLDVYNDDAVYDKQIVAVMTSFKRENTTIDCDNFLYRLYCCIWVGILPLRHFFNILKAKLKRKLFGKKGA